MRDHTTHKSSLYAKLDDQQIRVLETLPGTETEPFRYKLKHITLGDGSHYQTLSYLPAGSPTIAIYVNDHKLEVNESFTLALREVGKQDATQLIWVAEVCINHEDLSDRKHHRSLIRRISKEAGQHNIWHPYKPENGVEEVQKLPNILHIKEDDLSSPSGWDKDFLNPDPSSSWHRIASFFLHTHNFGAEDEIGHCLRDDTPTRFISLGETIASLFPKNSTLESTDSTAPGDLTRGNDAHSIFASMIERAAQGSADSKMILQTHLILAAILGLGLTLRNSSTAITSRKLDALESNVSPSEQDTATVNSLDMSYQHFIIPPASSMTSPLTLVAAPLHNHRGFQLHLEQSLIKLELPESKSDKTEESSSNSGKDNDEKAGDGKQPAVKEKGEDDKEAAGDGDDDKTPPTAESIALPADTEEELAFLNAIDLDQILDDSPSRLEWMKTKEANGEENSFLDQLMAMPDLENVKQHFLKAKSLIETLQRQEVDTATECLNAVFVGRPKVCEPVVRLYARFLMSIRAVSGDTFFETTVDQHKEANKYPSIKYKLSQITSEQSGVFYMTNPNQLLDDYEGDYHTKNLRKEMEFYQGKFVFLYSCAATDAMDPFLKSNTVGKQIPHIVKLDSGSEKDDPIHTLRKLLEERFQKKMQVEGGVAGEYARMLVRRASRGDEKSKSTALESTFSEVCRRQIDRISQERRQGESPDDYLITKEDILGPGPPNPLDQSQAWKEMMDMVEMDSVKESIRSFASLVRMNRQRELLDQPPLRVGLNRVFLGPPGTGKTTVAKLYGQILADLGMLSSGDIIVKNASDFIGQYVGWSEKAVKSAFESAKGKVLVIDEFHMLYPGKRSGKRDPGGDVFRIAVIDTLVAQIQNTPGEDRCVVLIGYTAPMREMFQYSNPGLARRFPLSDAFHFEDFSMDQLTRVLELKLDQQKIETTEKAKDVALQLLAMARDRPNFGNGGEVDNLLNHAITSQQRRVSADPSFDVSKPMLLQPEDFDADFDRLADSQNRSKENFKDFVGCEDIIARFDGYQQTVKGMRMHGINPRAHNLIPLNFVFKGAAGTGKTTMARKVGKVFYDMGFLSSAEVVECSVSDIIGESLGETGPKVISVLERALGKVLFIDEAYRLAQGDFARDAVNELVDCITKERFANKMVVILAGYETGMDALKNINQGFASRFGTEIVFQHLPPEHCLMLLQRFIAEFGIRIDGIEEDSLEGRIGLNHLRRLFVDLKETASWGNGRDVKTLARSVTHRVFMSSAAEDTASDNLAISCGDLQEIMRQMLVSKK